MPKLKQYYNFDKPRTTENRRGRYMKDKNVFIGIKVSEPLLNKMEQNRKELGFGTRAAYIRFLLENAENLLQVANLVLKIKT